MNPVTPIKTHRRRESSISTTATSPGAYVLAQEETPTRGTSSTELPRPAKVGGHGLGPDPNEIDETETPTNANKSIATITSTTSGYNSEDDQTPLPTRIDLMDRTKRQSQSTSSSPSNSTTNSPITKSPTTRTNTGSRWQTTDNDKGKGKARMSFGDEEDELGLGLNDDEDDDAALDLELGMGMGRNGKKGGTGDSDGSGSASTGSFNSDSMLEILDNDLDSDDLGLDDEEGDEGLGADAGDPLVSRGRRRRRRRYDESEEKQDKTLLELVPPLLLAHPLPLLPLLCSIPYNFLPAGVVFFIPIYCVLIVLSSCAHIVIVYLAWYLKVPSFEEVSASVLGRFGKYGRYAGRAAVIISTSCSVVGWLGTMYPLLSPLLSSHLASNSIFMSGIVWTVIPAACLLPSLLPSRMTRSLKRSPIFLVMLIPIVVFLVIGRTSEINKALKEGEPLLGGENNLSKRAPIDYHLGLGGRSSAGAGITTLAVFLSPHLNTLPIHRTLSRNKRSSFPVPCLISSAILLLLTLPFALVPYYLLPDQPSSETPSNPSSSAAYLSTFSGVFAQLPADDGWVNLARVLQCILSLGSCNMWILRCRDTILSSMGVERGERIRAGRWVGVGVWGVITALACVGGVLVEKIEMLGVIATLGVAWLLPSVFFIITFHVRSPLSIIFPNRQGPPQLPETPASALPSSRPNVSRSHSRADSLNDPSTDVLLARKERQLQKRRLGRRLWQDLIVYVGILPIGVITIAWSLGSFLGLW